MKVWSSFVFLWLVAILASSCSKKDFPTSPSNPPDTTAKKDTVALAIYQTYPLDTTTFYDGITLCRLDPNELPNVAGMAASRLHQGMTWVCNDKGGSSLIYLIDTTGAIRARVTVAGAPQNDWTDMAVGPGPESGIPYLYIADIGDSKEGRPYVYIYRVREPTMTLSSSSAVTGSTETAEKISFQYPDSPRDAETLLLDPSTKDLYVVSKDLGVNLYCLPYPQRTDTIVTATKLIRFPTFQSPRAGCISPDGNEILIKELTSIYYWKRMKGETILQSLLRTPSLVPLAQEAKGEAMCWSATGDAYFTISKFANNVIPPLNVYRRK